MRRNHLGAFVLAFTSSLGAGAMGAGRAGHRAEAKGPADAERLVAGAMQAELGGNVAQRRVLLSMAVDAAPDYLPARWQSGQVLAGGEWLPVDKAQAEAAADPNRAEYESLRKSAPQLRDGQLALARWCHKNAFDEEAKFHWRTVLAHDPNHKEALRAVGVEWFGGQLMSHADVEKAKKALRERKAAVKEFAPRVARWERMLSAGDLKSRNEALAEIRALREPAALPALEEITLDRDLATNADFEQCLWVSEALLPALAAIADPEATHSLVRHALVSQLKSVRESAIAALKQRPVHDYLPQLLGALTMPIESSYRVVTDNDGSVHYFHSLYREGPTADWSFESRRSAMQHDLRGPKFVHIDDRIRGEVTNLRFGSSPDPRVQAEIGREASRSQQKFSAQATAAEQAIASMNRATEIANRTIVALLVATTGQNLGENPHAWWDWWQRYNEYSPDGAPPVYETYTADSTHRYYNPPESYSYRFDPPPPPPRSRSCFAASTPVWTKTGLRPIEQLEIGDLVLAQNATTGELTYKPVIARTVRPPSPMRTIAVDGEEIEATLGHPFWVVGVGWRMAKELEDGASLHGVSGSSTVGRIEPRDDAEAYNLVVADFGTYFVGKTGLLVHDNTPREAGSGKLPGLAAK